MFGSRSVVGRTLPFRPVGSAKVAIAKGGQAELGCVWKLNYISIMMRQKSSQQLKPHLTQICLVHHEALMSGRWPGPAIVCMRFTQLEKVDNRSNWYWFKCNYCPDGGTGACIQG
jgi:hypothetical protein